MPFRHRLYNRFSNLLYEFGPGYEFISGSTFPPVKFLLPALNNINPGNTSATFQDIRNRKTGNTKFIDSMKEGVERWIDRLD